MPIPIIVCALTFNTWLGFGASTHDFYLVRSTIQCQQIADALDSSHAEVHVYAPPQLFELQAKCGVKLEDCSPFDWSAVK